MSTGPEVQSVGSAQARLLSPSYPQAAFSPGSLILPYKESPVSEQYVCVSLVEVARVQLTIHFSQELN